MAGLKSLLDSWERFAPLRRRGIRGMLLLIHLALGLTFIYSGVEKIAHPQQFLATIYDFRLVGPVLGLTIAVIMPWLELLLGLALLIGIYPGGTLLAAGALGAMFLVVQASAIVRGLSISCGCFGPDEAHLVGKATFLRTSMIFLATGLAWIWHYFIVAPPRKTRAQRLEEEDRPLIGLRKRDC